LEATAFYFGLLSSILIRYREPQTAAIVEKKIMPDHRSVGSLMGANRAAGEMVLMTKPIRHARDSSKVQKKTFSILFLLEVPAECWPL